MRLGTLRSTGQDRATWLVLLYLLLGVVMPAGAVFWFMNEAVRNQADADRQRVSDAYRGQLRLLRDRIDQAWRERARDLSAPGQRGPVAFRRAVVEGLSDSIMYFGPDGSPAYPSIAVPRGHDALDARPEWRLAQVLEDAGNLKAAASAYAAFARVELDPSLAARALQAHLRCLVRIGDRAPALRAIDTHFLAGRLVNGRDVHGRLIAADAQLLALGLVQASDPRFSAGVERLVTLLNDYEQPVLGSAQRLFLMDEVAALAPAASFPTRAAETLAARLLESGTDRTAGAALEATSLPGVWKLGVQGGGVALFRTATVIAVASRVLDGVTASSDARFAMTPPGSAAGDESVAAGPLLPGWQISFSLVDARRIEGDARRRVATYLWAGSIAIAALAVTGLLLWQSFRRQLRLARLKTDLVAAVSHELKTPLASMRLLVDSLLQDATLDPGKTRDYLRLIAGENARLSRLIEHFLTFSRLERRRQRFAFADVAPSAVVQSAVAVARERLETPGSQLHVEVGNDLPPLHADEDALVTVLLNLLDNAYKYTPGDKRIALHAFREGDAVVFEVEDNGIGITQREQKRIFKDFYQVDQRLARETGGCGLGLSIVDFIVRAHGGAVSVRSEAGVGSTFRVSLPGHSAAADGARA